MKNTKIILCSAYGNHSNRLFQSIHFEAFCKEHNVDFTNPTFSDMRKYYFPNSSTNWRFNFILQKFPVIFKIMKKLNLVKVVSFDSENQNNITELLALLSSQPRRLFVSGWAFRVHELTKKYQNYFISKYSLREEYFKNNILLDKINKLKESDKIVVGVHIRRGDYKYYMESKYYFDDNVYIKYMEKIKKEIDVKYNKKYGFIIFSNENLSISENEYTFISNNEWYVDHMLMSKCDFLLGPPSTFTMWASYIGKVKYFHIENDNGNIDLDSFTYCIG